VKPILTITETPDADSVAQITTGLETFNERHAGARSQSIAVLATDPGNGRTLGGLLGRISLGWLFIDLFFLPEELRGNGFGTHLIGVAENEARRRGCRHSVLYTLTFQAPDFYSRRGYETFGRIECDPPGHARVFMHKELQ
jgi:GNAT superfamily N-acetyltransferase